MPGRKFDCELTEFRSARNGHNNRGETEGKKDSGCNEAAGAPALRSQLRRGSADTQTDAAGPTKAAGGHNLMRCDLRALKGSAEHAFPLIATPRAASLRALIH